MTKIIDLVRTVSELSDADLKQQFQDCPKIAQQLVQGSYVGMWYGRGHYLCVYWYLLSQRLGLTDVIRIREYDEIFLKRKEIEPL